MVDAYMHLNEPQKAFELAKQLKQLKLRNMKYYQKLAEKPFSYKC
jgi:hypothetical protein